MCEGCCHLLTTFHNHRIVVEGEEKAKTVKWLFVDAFIKADNARGRSSQGERSCLESREHTNKVAVLCKEEQKFHMKVAENFTTLRKVVNTVASIIGRYTSPEFHAFSNYACLCRLYVKAVLTDAQEDFTIYSDKAMIQTLLSYFEEKTFTCCFVQLDYNYTPLPCTWHLRDFYKPVDVDYVIQLCEQIFTTTAHPEECRVQFVDGLSSIVLMLFSCHGGYAPHKRFYSPVDKKFEWFIDWYEEFTSEMVSCGFESGEQAIYKTAVFFQHLTSQSTFEPSGQDPYSTPRRRKGVWNDADSVSQPATAPHTPERALQFHYDYIPASL